MNFLHNYIPQPVAFEIFNLTIRWYSICIVLGIVLAVILVVYLAKKKKIESDDVYDLAFWVVIFGIIGARLYEVFFINWGYYQNNPFNIIKIWNGGIAIHGGIIAGVLALYLWTKIKKYSFWLWADLVVIGLTLGQMVGRWGNYFNQENFGSPTNLPWGIPIELVNRPVEFLQSSFFHPTFLYESILSLGSLLFLLWIWKKKMPIGVVASIYLIEYGLIRFIMEFIRIDETPIIFGLRLPIVVSILMIVVGMVLVGMRIKKNA